MGQPIRSSAKLKLYDSRVPILTEPASNMQRQAEMAPPPLNTAAHARFGPNFFAASYPPILPTNRMVSPVGKNDEPDTTRVARRAVRKTASSTIQREWTGKHELQRAPLSDAISTLQRQGGEADLQRQSEGSEGDFDLAPLVPTGLKLEDLAVLRDLYAQGTKAISIEASLMLSKGVPADEVADWAVKARNNLKAQIRAEGPKIVKVITEARNMKKYGNPLGLTAEEWRARGKTNKQIIESAGKANSSVSKWAGRLRVAGRILIAIDLGLAAYHVATAPEVDRPKLLLEETGAIAGAIAGGEAGAIGGAEVGAWIGGVLGGGATAPIGGEGAIPGALLGGAIGGVIGGIGGAIGGAWTGKKLAGFIAEQYYPPDHTAFEGSFQ